jgi:5-deoxy-glucuronate isomerase
MSELLIKPNALNESGESLSITPESTGFEYLTLRIRRMLRGEDFSGETNGSELGIVVLGGRCSVKSSAGTWNEFGSRASVFDGMPTALYLPLETEFSVRAETDCELAFCFSRAEEKFPARLIAPEEVEVEVRGGANATRQINHILKPEFPA